MAMTGNGGASSPWAPLEAEATASQSSPYSSSFVPINTRPAPNPLGITNGNEVLAPPPSNSRQSLDSNSVLRTASMGSKSSYNPPATPHIASLSSTPRILNLQKSWEEAQTKQSTKSPSISSAGSTADLNLRNQLVKKQTALIASNSAQKKRSADSPPDETEHSSKRVERHVTTAPPTPQAEEPRLIRSISNIDQQPPTDSEPDSDQVEPIQSDINPIASDIRARQQKPPVIIDTFGKDGGTILERSMLELNRIDNSHDIIQDTPLLAGGSQRASAPPGVCEICGTTQTPMWRKDDQNRRCCNSCGLHFKLKGYHKQHPDTPTAATWTSVETLESPNSATRQDPRSDGLPITQRTRTSMNKTTRSNGDDHNRHSMSINQSTTSNKTSKESAPSLQMGGDRPYSMWKGASGRLEPAMGALLPTGYQLSGVDDLPFLCPIRDCQRLCKSLTSVGAHFSSKHRGIELNDNCDGTFTVVRDKGSRISASVVSNNPIDPSAEPPAQAWRHPTDLQKHVQPQPQSQPPLTQPTPQLQHQKPTSANMATAASESTNPGTPWADSASNAMDYIMQYLDPRSSEMVYPSWLHGIGNLARQRDIPSAWLAKQENTILNNAHLTAALIYLTGVVITSHDLKCLSCKTDTNPIFPYCVVASNEGLQFLKAPRTDVCASCFLRSARLRSKLCCSFASPVAKTEYVVSQQIIHDEGNNKSIAQARVVGTALSQTPPVESFQAADMMTAAMSRTPVVGDLDSGLDLSPSAKVSEKRNERPTDECFVYGGSSKTAAVLEMEDWELAPGRMCSKEASSENIAYSNSYLTSMKPIPVSNNVGFNVVVIKPGSANQWPAMPNKIRMCAVASGKVRVKIDGAEFQIGQNGLFKIKPDVGCWIQNRLYVDTVLHITTLSAS